jgi:DNA repair protein RecN (Recombination protein N)
MLSMLKVRNLALVESADVAFGPGLNIVSGETGAGKSVLIGALYLLLGERADTGAVRSGAAQCTVEAAFSLEPGGPLEAVDAILEETGLPPCEDGTLVIRRTVKAAGGGQAWVNDTPATAGFLRRIGASLVDLHGPHDHQLLFHPAEQLAILDAYARDAAERDAYAAVWSRRAALLEKKAALEAAGGPDAAAQADWLASQVKEIEEAALEEGEEESVRDEQRTAGNAQRILELGQLVTQTLSEGDGCILQLLVPARKALDELARLMPAAEGWPAELKPLADGLAALSVGIQRELSSVEADPARLEWLDRRLGEYERLKRKYGPTLADVRRTLADAKTRLDEIENRGARLEALSRELAATDADLQKAGAALRKKRLAAAAKLAPAIRGELRAIGFANAAFAIPVEPAPAPQADGLDATDFGFAPNEGEPMRPLRAIASSGEISRVMLAVKAVLAAADRVGTLVFDEIDANIGGETAPAVGRKLAQVARGRQVIAITHLPAVAACGAIQFAVRKDVEDGRTRTHVRLLSDEDRVDEIARMLGGRDITTVSLRHARELLRNSAPSP